VLCAALAFGQHQTDAAVSETTPSRILGLQYPRLAIQAFISGKVELEAGVLSDGTVKEVKTIMGHPLLVPGATDSLRQWRFKPCASSAGECRAKVTFLFVLEKGMCPLGPFCPTEVEIDLPATITIRSIAPESPEGGIPKRRR
jgi:hypothetical protein